MKKEIKVVGAAFISNGRLFAARRSYGSEYVIHKYEFVGGKIKDGETPQQAIVRECAEELSVKTAVVRPVGRTVYEYPDVIVDLQVFECKAEGGFAPLEHEETKWLSSEEIDPDDWAPADRQILSAVKRSLTASYTLITGATGVLGGEFCMQCAASGENLYLTGRSKEKLQSLRSTIAEKFPDINIIAMPCNLDDEHSRAELFADAANYKFSRLVNCAGADIQKAFCEYDEKKLVFQIRGLYEGAVSLSRFCIEHRAESLGIINISSVSGIYPMPYFAIYSSLKGALTSFSVALAAELKGSGVTVTAVLPGAIYTRADVKEYIKEQGLWGKIAAKNPAFVVKKSLKAAAKGKVKYIPGFANKLMNITTKFVPARLRTKFIAAKWANKSKDAFTVN
ncbi:MAG: SDR family NAD(P)-dependent oxidoreductase [Clostridia bacterium]|nr:SDR family NAD(P)-dependent oxidoreductase [Clostridia bacterium]